MSMKDAIPHLHAAVKHAEAGNAAKAMHHVGHALFNLKSMTAGAGGASRLPPSAPTPQNLTSPKSQGPVAGSLRARLAAQGGGMGGMNDHDGDEGGY